MPEARCEVRDAGAPAQTSIIHVAKERTWDMYNARCSTDSPSLHFPQGVYSSHLQLSRFLPVFPFRSPEVRHSVSGSSHPSPTQPPMSTGHSRGQTFEMTSVRGPPQSSSRYVSAATCEEYTKVQCINFQIHPSDIPPNTESHATAPGFIGTHFDQVVPSWHHILTAIGRRALR